MHPNADWRRILADHMNFLRLLSLGTSLLIAGCVSLQVADFAEERPLLDPVTFFGGRTTSVGVMENPGGGPRQRIKTETAGHWEGNSLHLEQDLFFSGGKSQHRSWLIQKLDANHYQATANDIVGVARGEARGNVFHWSFTLALAPGNPLANVRMSQWMYLQPDGRTLLNHSTIRKFGIVVAQVTEQFRKETH